MGRYAPNRFRVGAGVTASVLLRNKLYGCPIRKVGDCLGFLPAKNPKPLGSPSPFVTVKDRFSTPYGIEEMLPLLALARYTGGSWNSHGRAGSVVIHTQR